MDVDTIGKKSGKIIPAAIIMTPGPPPCEYDDESEEV